MLQSLRRPHAAPAIRVTLGRNATHELANVLQDGLKLRAMRTASEHSPELITPTAPRDARGDDRHCRSGDREKRKCCEQESLSRRLPPRDETKIVHEHDVSQRSITFDHWNGARVRIPARQVRRSVPRGPLGKR